MTSTLFDIEPIELLDFEPDIPCDAYDHHTPDAAKWLIYWKPVFACGCNRSSDHVTPICDPCWKTWCISTMRCLHCGARIARLSGYIERIETLKK